MIVTTHYVSIECLDGCDWYKVRKNDQRTGLAYQAKQLVIRIIQVELGSGELLLKADPAAGDCVLGDAHDGSYLIIVSGTNLCMLDHELHQLGIFCVEVDHLDFLDRE